MNPNLQPHVPNPQQPNRRFSSTHLTAIIVVGIIFCSCALCGIIGGIGIYLNPPKTPSTATTPSSSPIASSPSPTTNKSSSPARSAPNQTYSKMVQNLAIIEGAQNNEAKKSRIASLLSQLDKKYPENEEQIGDMTAGAYSEIKKRGHSASIIGIMEAMITVSEAKSSITYADAVTAYALLRVNGMK